MHLFTNILRRVSRRIIQQILSFFLLSPESNFRDLKLFLTRKELREERRRDSAGPALGGVYTKKQNVLTEVSQPRPVIGPAAAVRGKYSLPIGPEPPAASRAVTHLDPLIFDKSSLF